MKPATFIVCSVAASDVEIANQIAAKIDYEPESLGVFFIPYNSTGQLADGVACYICGLDVRPWTAQAIQLLLQIRDHGQPEGLDLPPALQEIVDMGGLPDSFVLHEQKKVELVIDALAMKPMEGE